MWEILDDDVIVMTAGDTPRFKITCNVEGTDGNLTEYTPVTGDEFVFACKRSKSSSSYLFKITIPNDTMILQFKESDTKSLSNGNYIWEVSLNKPDEDYHCTFIAEKTLKITTEVY